MRPARDPDRPVRHLEWRIRLVGAGAILAVFGIAGDVEILRWAAFGVLGIAAVLSFRATRTRRDADATGESEDEDELRI